MHFGSIQINFAWIHVSYFSNFQNKLICIDTNDLVSIHSSSVWTERYSCIDTCLHASIHAANRLTCIDTNINMYRYKTRETVLYDNFHSFMHQIITNLFFSNMNTLKTLIPNSLSPSKLNQNFQHLTSNHFKFGTHS